ncbi:MAG: response regulator [Magnetococcus sp. WYHC-3]
MKRLLVVDDNPVNRKLALALIRQFGHAGEAVDNGALALERLAKGGIDLVLMDCHMPVLDGMETTRRLRAAGLGAPGHLPVIAVSANSSDDMGMCRAAGMDDYLSKPLDYDKLKCKLDLWLTA